MAEALNSLFKGELVRNRGPWRSIDDLEIAVVEWVHWYNHRRLHGEIGLIPPVEYETTHYTATAHATACTQPFDEPDRAIHASIKAGT